MPEQHKPLRPGKPHTYTPQGDGDVFELAEEGLPAADAPPQEVDVSKLDALLIADDAAATDYSSLETSGPDFEATLPSAGTDGYELAEEVAAAPTPVIKTDALVALTQRMAPGHKLEGKSVSEITKALAEALKPGLSSASVEDLKTLFRDAKEALGTCTGSSSGTEASILYEHLALTDNSFRALQALEESLPTVFAASPKEVAETFLRDVLKHLGPALPGTSFFNASISEAREVAGFTMILASKVGLRSEDTATGRSQNDASANRERLQALSSKGPKGGKKEGLTLAEKKARLQMGAKAFDEQKAAEETGATDEAAAQSGEAEVSYEDHLKAQQLEAQKGVIDRAAPGASHTVYQRLIPTFGSDIPDMSDSPLWLQAAADTGTGEEAVAKRVEKFKQDTVYSLASSVGRWVTDELKRVSRSGEFNPGEIQFESAALGTLVDKYKKAASRISLKEEICQQLLTSAAEAIYAKGEDAVSSMTREEATLVQGLAAKGLDKIRHAEGGGETMQAARREAREHYQGVEQAGFDAAKRMRLDRFADENQ